MKRIITISSFVVSCMCFCSCSVQQYLPAGERLYRGAEINVIKNPEIKESVGSLKSTIKLAARPRPNKFIFGFPYKVWFWYVIGETTREKGFKPFLKRKLAEEPILSSRINTISVAENIESLMGNLGYFKTKAKGDTVNTEVFTKAIYNVTVEPQYTLNEVKWVDDGSKLLQLLQEESGKNGILKKGMPYRLSDISLERERLDLYLKTQGYYYFNPDYIMAYADSTIGNRQVNILLNLKRITPKQAKETYQINRISIFPNFNLSELADDSSEHQFKAYDGLYIRKDKDVFKDKLFAKSIIYRSDSIYSSTLQNNTLNRLINLGAFKFVKNRFDLAEDSGKSNRLNVSYFLTPAKPKSVTGSLDGFTKDNSFLGSKIGINWRNKNTFGGAEQLNVKLYGGFETSLVDSLKENNNFRVGSEIVLKLPSYAIPFFKIKENNFYPANTNIAVLYEWFRKKLFYTKHFFKFQYEFVRKPNFKTLYTFAPVSLIYTNTTNVTAAFSEQLQNNPSLITSIYPEAVLGSFFSYTHFSPQEKVRSKWFFNGSVDLSGNMAGALLGARNYREKKVLNVPFSQFVKFDVDFHYTQKVSRKADWANRIQLGIGIPYNNSKALPFAKLYTIGGSTSLRGFNARGVGPGKLKASAINQNLFQLIGGDFRLLMNSEYRIPLNKLLGAAFFVDAGNTWTKDTILFGPEGKLTKDFYKEIAVAAGAGIRLDLTVLLLRFDLGIPLRKPYLPDGKRWVIDEIDFSRKSWRRENLILNIGIGLPF